jgi:uncharacterized phage protein (TIGR01671 family)
MREIKFRVWDNADKCFWYSDNDFHFDNGCSISDKQNLPRGSVLEQYTGLKDKNGVEIYEGDTIDIHQTVNGCNLFNIVWDRFQWSAEYGIKMIVPRLYEYDLEELFDLKDSMFDKEIEVVGNIHE